MTYSYEEAIAWVKEAIDKKETLSVGLVSDAGDLLERLLKDNYYSRYFNRPDIGT
jgi:urocanate hydratase